MAKRCANCNAVFMNDEVRFCAKCGSPDFVPVHTDSAEQAPVAETPAAPVSEASDEAITQELKRNPAEQAPVAEAPAAPADEWANMSAEIQNDRGAFDNAAPAFGQAAPAAPSASAYSAAAPAFTSAAPEGNAAPGFGTVEPVKRKKKIKPARIIFPAVAVILAAVLIFTNVGYLIGATLTKWFGSDRAYLQVVEKHAISSYASTVTDYYEDYFKNNIDNARIEGNVSVSLGKQAKSLAKMYDIDLGALDAAGFDFVYNSKGDRLMSMLALTMGGKDILSAEMVFDGKEGAAYVKLKELTSKILRVEIPDSVDIDTAKYKKALEKMLPKPATVEKLVGKYAKIALKEIKDVDVYSDTVEVDELSQKLTVVEYTISEETLYNMGMAVVKAAKKDKDIKNIIKNIEKGYEELDAELPDDLYDEFIDALDNAEDELDSASPSDDTMATVYSYVNGKHEVVGRMFSQGEDSDEKYGYVKVYDGNKFEVKAELGGVYGYGSGTEKGGKINGEITEYSGSDEIITIEFEDFEKNAAKKGKLKGTVRITPGKALKSMLSRKISDSSVRRIINSLDFALEVKMDVTKKGGNITYTFLVDGAEFVSLDITTKRSSGKKVSVPDGDTIDVTDEDELEEFIEDIDFDKVLRNLKKAGLPEELIDGLEDAISNIGRKDYAKSYSYY